MNIKVNGQELILEQVITIKELLNLQQVEMQDYVTVQINEEIVEQENFASRSLNENDAVEFLYFMGGGSK
ncbi:MAG: sulfur carrier protein ThiS [Desulfitobacteriaceae bacterium]